MANPVAASSPTAPTAPTTDEDFVRPSDLTHKISLTLFWGIHVACLAAFATGVSARAVVIALVLFWVRMFAITGGYHRYFSHKSYKTSRGFQFLLGLLGTSCIQKGPVWWAATHRHHHKFSDMPEDVHSPKQSGFWYSHVGWITGKEQLDTDLRVVKDLAKFPELMWLGKYHFVPPTLLAVACYFVAGWSGVVVGMGWSTVLLWHATFTINSLSHVFGSRRYETTDTSRNNLWLALLTMGEGWHNNHHHYMNSVKQGFFWWEIDASYYVLRALAAVGIVWDLKLPPERILKADPAAALAPVAAVDDEQEASAAVEAAA